jgi:hypothetical protein
MRRHLLITTAIGLMLGTGAWAQSPSERSNRPPAAQTQTNPNPSSSQPAPSSAASTPSANPAPSAQNAQSTSPGSREGTTTSQSSPNPTGGNDTTRSQAQSNQPSQPSRSDNNATTAPSQTQSAQQPNASSQAQTNTAPPANNNQNQPATNSANNANPNANATAGNQPANNQGNTAQSSSTNVNVSANLNDNQRTRFSESITRLNVKPVNNVNFSLSVGTVVPRDVQFQPLPADVVEIVPQYRGYDFFVVREDIVIVEPSTYKIVDVLPRSGRSTAQAPASQPTAAAAASRKTTFSDSDREVIRKHARSSRTEQRPSRTEERSTTGSATASSRVRVGDRLPDSVEIRSFPDEVYQESPTLRDYRYIERDNRTYVVEPRERTIIEEIE